MDKAQKDALKREQERIKLEVADSIGLGDKVRTVGWGGLTTQETGRIGGLLGHRFILERQAQKNSSHS